MALQPVINLQNTFIFCIFGFSIYQMKVRLIFILGMFCLSLGAQKNRNLANITFDSHPISDEFVSKSIYRIFQDGDGYIWFGTENRIYRYDGYRLRTYFTEVGHSNQLSNNEVLCFAEDNNTIWVGTNQGIRLIDKMNYQIRDWDYEPLINVRINSLMRDSKNNIWIGTQNGLYKHSINSKETHVYKYIYGDNNSLQGNGINSVYEDFDKNIWITMWDCGLCKYVPERDNFDRYPEMPGRNNPFRIFQDKDKNYWIATWGAGLYRFYPSKEGTSAYELFEIRKKNTHNAEKIFFSIAQDDRYGYIWLISYTGIFVITDVENEKYEELEGPELTESNNLYNEIVKDKNGNFWIGTYGNIVYTINMNKPNITNYDLQNTNNRFEISPSLSAIYEDKSGLLWLGLKRMGIHFFDRKTNQFVPSLFDKKTINLLEESQDVNNIREIKSRNEVWLSLENSYTIFVVKKHANKVNFERIIDLNIDLGKYPLTENSISEIIEDRDGNVWIGTLAGLFMIDKAGNQKRVEQVMHHITSVSEDKYGNIWISGSNNGVSCLQKDGKITDYTDFENNNIQSILCQTSGRIWVGCSKGKLYCYDSKTDTFNLFVNEITKKAEPVLDIIEDGNGHVWVSLNKKIVEIDPLIMNSYVYTKDDGFIVTVFNKKACFTSRSGHAVFGGNRGFCYFPNTKLPNSINNKNQAVITDINLHEQSIFDTGFLNNVNLKAHELVLEPFQNNIEITFSSFNYFSKSKIEFAYKIEGIDDKWNEVSGERNFAVYNNLGKGKYKFIVKIKDEYGVWDNNYTTLLIYKKPHFYETWWALLFYIAVVIFILYLFYRSSLKRLKLKNDLQIAQIEKKSSEQLVQTKLRYFTNISHELMTPLTIISFLIEDVRKNSKENNWQFNTILSNVSRLKRLLQQILDFRKVESGNMTLKIQWGDIVSFARNICEYNFRPLIQRKKINFEFSASSEKIELYYDADKIDKSLYNLLSNAIKYTPEGGSVHVRIETVTHNDENYLRIIVSDTGKGIAPEEVENIFKRFYHSTKATNEYSNGIGLSLTKELIELHHGTITVESQLNAGTSFFVEIPMDTKYYAENDYYSETIPQTEEIILTGTEEHLDEKRNETKSDTTILIVEDNPDLRIILDKILSYDYNTVMGKNGKQALEIISENDIDLIISDVSMPEMDGLELCRIIKNNIETSHLPVLLITARNTIEDRVECYNAGADGYLSKPFEQQVLEAKIKSLLKNRKTKQSAFQMDMNLDISTIEYPSSEELFLNKIVDIVIEKYLADSEFLLDDLAEELNMSRSSLYRKIKLLTGLSPSDFVRNIRLKHACVLLKRNELSIKEVAFDIGFADARYFSMSFKNEFGMTPSEFQKKHKIK